MTEDTGKVEQVRATEIARGLLDLGASLYGCRDVASALNEVLRQARGFSRAEAGSLYLAQDGVLTFVAVQNDRLGSPKVWSLLGGRKIAIDKQSLAGFVASTGRPYHVPNCREIATDSPFRVNHELDARVGYRVESILAIPLTCPNGGCIGVMELFNRLDEEGNPGAFPEEISEGVFSLASQAAIAVHNLKLQDELRRAHLNSIFRLSGVAEYRDADTGEHVQRVSRTSELIAEALGLDAAQIELIKYASPMHDVGKVAIPDAILLKPGHLTSSQRRLMERHTLIGADIFGDPEDEVLATARQVAMHHHERWDGQGYPDGLKHDATPLSGRIVALADVFDAVVSKRCYKDACSLDVALDIVDKDSGNHFDPEVAKAFNKALDDVLESYPHLKAA